MAERKYSSTAGEMTLQGGVTSVATSIIVDTVTGLPATAPFTVVLDPGNEAEEIVTVTEVSGTTLTVTRGEDGTTATAHDNGAKARHMATARDFRESQQHINATTDVHGITGAFVDEESVQTLTNKTLQMADDATPAVILQAVADATQDTPLLRVIRSDAVEALEIRPDGFFTWDSGGAASGDFAVAFVTGDGGNFYGRLVHVRPAAAVDGVVIDYATGATGDALQVLLNDTEVAAISASGAITGSSVDATSVKQGGVQVVTTTGSHTLTNKTLTSPTITSPTITRSGLSLLPLIVCTSSTRPSSVSEGQEIYETDTDRKYVYNGTSWILTSGRTPAVGVYRNADGANLAASTWTSVPWTHAITGQADSTMWSTSAATRLIAPVAGWYQIVFNFQLEEENTGGDVYGSILANSVRYRGNSLSRATDDPGDINVTAFVPLAANEYVEAQVYAEVAASRVNTLSANSEMSPRAQMVWVRPL